MSYQIKNRTTGEILYDGDSAARAIEVAVEWFMSTAKYSHLFTEPKPWEWKWVGDNHLFFKAACGPSQGTSGPTREGRVLWRTVADGNRDRFHKESREAFQERVARQALYLYLNYPPHRLPPLVALRDGTELDEERLAP